MLELFFVQRQNWSGQSFSLFTEVTAQRKWAYNISYEMEKEKKQQNPNIQFYCY